MTGFRFHPVLSGTLGLSLVLGLLGGPAWAQSSATLQEFRCRNDVLTLSAAGGLPQPRWETWQSVVGGSPTRMMVLDLPEMTGDLSALKAQLAEIERANPNFSRLLLLPMTNGNLRLVMEMTEAPGRPLAPRLERVSSGEVAIVFHSEKASPGAGPLPPSPPPALQVSVSEPPASTADRTDVQAGAREEALRLNALVASLTRDLEATRRENTVLADRLDELRRKPTPAGKAQPSAPDAGRLAELERRLGESKAAYEKLRDRHESLRGHLEASLQENVKLQRKLEARNGKATAAEDPAKTLELLGQLQATIDERDDLQQQVQDLQRILGEQERAVADLRHQLALQNDMIRTSDPGLSGVDITDERANANLRSALLRVSVRLKAAEEELARLGVRQAATPDLPPSAPPETLQGVMILDERKLLVRGEQAQVQPLPTSEAALRRKLDEDPSSPQAYLALNDYYVRHRNYSAAESVLQDLLATDPRYAGAYYELARLYLMQQRPERAQLVLQTYRRLNPQDAQRIATLEQMIESQSSKESRP